jgi:hypothetical protein
MRFIKLLAIVPLLTGCAKDYSEFQLNSKEIAELNPERVYLTNLGLYIQLDSFFVEESGLFTPIRRMESSELKGSYLRYTRLSGNVFSYVISG